MSKDLVKILNYKNLDFDKLEYYQPNKTNWQSIFELAAFCYQKQLCHNSHRQLGKPSGGTDKKQFVDVEMGVTIKDL